MSRFLDAGLAMSEERLIDRVAKWIANQDLESPAIILIQTIKPISTIGGDLALFFLAPFLPMLEEKGYDFIETFQRRENLEKLIQRLEQISKEKSVKTGKTRASTLWSWLQKRF